MRDRFLRVLGADPRTWATRYGITPVEHPCDACGAVLATTVPIASGTLRGLAAPTCACGNADVPYVIVRDLKHGDLLDRPLEEP